MVDQTHYGAGDNVGRDKIVNNYLFGSVDYQELAAEIAEVKEDLQDIPAERLDKRLKKAEKLKALEDRLEELRRDVFRLHELFTKIPLNTERQRQAKAHFDKGEFREADAVLKADEISGEVAQLKKGIAEVKAEAERKVSEMQGHLKDRANEFVLKARLCVISKKDSADWFKQSCGFFEQALDAARIPGVLFEYASFLQDQNQFKAALPFYEEALGQYRYLVEFQSEEYWPFVAMTLNNIGMLYGKMNAFDLARVAYEEALQIYQALVESQQKMYLHSVVAVMNNLGILYRQLNCFELAQRVYEGSLRISRELSLAQPEFLSLVATTLNNLGELYCSMNYFEMSKASYEEALQIRRELSLARPEVYLFFVATTLNNLGTLHYSINSFEFAQKYYEESLQIRRRLAFVQPEKNLPMIAKILSNLGVLYSLGNAFESANLAYEEALQIRRKLVAEQSEIFLPDLSATLVNLSAFYLQSVPNKEKSIALAMEAAELLLPLHERVPVCKAYLHKALQLLQANGVEFGGEAESED